MAQTVTTTEHEAPVLADVDVVVAGGGSAGLAAAVSAARQGAKTILVEQYGFFGGNAVSAYVGTICGLYTSGPPQSEEARGMVCHGFAREWAEALQKEGWGFGPVPFRNTSVILYVPWGYKRVADRVVRDTPNLKPLLHAPIVDAYLEDSKLRGLIVGSKRGPVAILGKIFIDASGDADLAFHAGCIVETSPPGMRQFPSMQFVMENVDFQSSAVSMLSGLLSNEGQQPEWDLSREGGAVFPTFRPGEVLGAMTRIKGPKGGPPDMTDLEEATYAEMAGRDEADKAHRFLKTYLPGFEDSFLGDTPTQIGIRETRRVAGEYVLSHEDIVGAARFEDSIGCGAWPEEFHWKGKGTDYVWLETGAYYQMPYRMLQAKEFDNLLVAGRCSSAAPEALASTRVIAPSMVQGQAAGIAAAVAASQRTSVKEVDVSLLQKTLTDSGAHLG